MIDICGVEFERDWNSRKKERNAFVRQKEREEKKNKDLFGTVQVKQRKRRTYEEAKGR